MIKDIGDMIMIIGEKILRDLYPNLDEEQYQPNSIDLKLEKLEGFVNAFDEIGMMNGEKHLPRMFDYLPLEEHDGKIVYGISPHTACLATIEGVMKIPDNVMQLYYLRSSLMRMGISMMSCVGDSGFNGHLKFLLINNTDNLVLIEKGERIATAVSYLVADSGTYKGDYNE